MSIEQMIKEQYLEYTAQLKELEILIMRKLATGEDCSKELKKAAGIKMMKEEAERMVASSAKPYIHPSNQQEEKK